MALERIVAAIVDTKQLTLYREDGTTIHLPQGDPRIRDIVAQVMPLIQSDGVAEVDLTHLPNAYKQFEEQSKGIVRLFRVAKAKVASIFGGVTKESIDDVVENGGVVGSIPGPSTMMQAVDEILSEAESVGQESFKDADTTEDHTMIAVVTGDDGSPKVIPGVETLKEQFDYAGRLGSVVGMQNFFRRLANVIDSRPHSVEDLLRFLEKGDLPIADDGSIIAYKRLFSQDETFVDPHTRKVTQKAGSYVCVDHSLVDLSRRNECSNGLHIGRRGYMGSFSGDALFMAKIAPEDVMVVPHNDPNKVRVCGYHLIERVNANAFSLICSNRPATTDRETADLLSKVIAGNHPPAREEVRITAQRGGGIQIFPLDNKGNRVAQVDNPVKKHTALDDGSAGSVDPKNVSEEVAKTRETMTQKEKAVSLANRLATGDESVAPELLAIKKKAKVTWERLGVLREIGAKAEQLASSTATVHIVTNITTKTVEEKPEQAGVTKAKSQRAITIQGFEDTMKDATKNYGTRLNAGEDLIAYRKRSKVSWERLGRPDLTDDIIRAYIKTIPAEMPKQKPEPKAKAAPAEASKLTGTVPEQARNLYNNKAWNSLATFKKKKKKSWKALGFTASEEAEIAGHLKG